MLKNIIKTELSRSESYERIQSQINTMYLNFMNVSFNKNIIKKNELSIDFFNILAEILGVRTIRSTYTKISSS